MIPLNDEQRLYRGKTIPQVPLNWLLQRPMVSTVLIGARNEEQLLDNLGAVGWLRSRCDRLKLPASEANPLRLRSEADAYPRN